MTQQNAHEPMLHMTPREVWERQRAVAVYVPEGFEREGFVHCTNGEQELIAVGNRYYTADPRPFVVLTLESMRLSAPIRYDDGGTVFPHVYGPLETVAVVDVRELVRGADGNFVAIGVSLAR